MQLSEWLRHIVIIRILHMLIGCDLIEESVDSLCRDGADAQSAGFSNHPEFSMKLMLITAV